MISLAIKYRPKCFEDVVEQKAIKQILQDQLETKTHKNCYLFTGGAGTGKTTCARIFANEINEHKGTPIEIDGASNNGVEQVREIIDNAKFKALDAEYKVYIIDECHMLSNGAWNAMLKLLEEPPAQTIFLMCTTDPQKIPATILSRVQRYDFQRITYNSVVDRLKYIMEQEQAEGSNVTYTKEALEYIAKIADGGMRDAITLLDKCISYNPDVTEATVVEALGTVDYSTMIELSKDLLSGHNDLMITTIENTYRSGVDLKQFMRQYSYFLLDACKFMLISDFEYLQIPSLYEKDLELICQEYDDVLSLLQSVVQLNTELKWEQNPKALIEARLLLFCDSEV